MKSEPEAPKIPAEFVDYRRRLIIYNEPKEINGLGLTEIYADLAKRLQEEFGALPLMMTFQIGNIQVMVAYLADERHTVAGVIDILRRDPDFIGKLVFKADSRVELSATPADPLYRFQWALKTIEAEAAWARVDEILSAQPHPPVRVAIVDSGIKLDHQDLIGKSVVPAGLGNVNDDDGHGTMLAGTIAATANNIGIVGEAINVRILPIKISAARTPPTALAAIVGILQSLQYQSKVINLAWHCLDDTGLLAPSISLAGTRGCVVVVAAGNYGSDNDEYPTVPASYGLNNMIVAMASDWHDRKSWFSNYGASVDLAAPGERILTTGLYYRDHPRYPEYNGTSASAAHVAGAAVLLLAIDDTWAPSEIRDQLNASAVQPRALARLCKSNGRLNLRRAVLGPINVTIPSGGEQLHQGAALDVQWVSEYDTPFAQTLQISFRDTASGAVLSTFIGIPNSQGPNSKYADSKSFDIV